MKIFVLVGCLLGLSNSALAYPSGIVGESGKQGQTCNSRCHFGGAPPSVSLTGPDTLTAGAEGTYQFTITGGAGVVGGLDVALSSSAAKLGVVTVNTQVAAGELTHSQPLPFVDGKVTVSFTVTAPPTAGTLTLYAAGNSTNGNGQTTGDDSATTTRMVTIQAPDGGVDPPALDGGASSGGNPDSSATPPDQGNSPPASSGGCTVGGHSPTTNIVLLLGFGLTLLLCRRCRSRSFSF